MSKNLHNQIRDLFKLEKESNEMMQSKLELFDSLCKNFKDSDFFVVGSSYTGLSLKKAPIHIIHICDCLVTNPRQSHICSRQIKLDMRKSKRYFENVSESNGQILFSDPKFLVRARIEFSCNKNKIRNSFLIRTYSRLDARVAPLLFVVRHWLSRPVNVGVSTYLTSFSITMMMIHYLQVGCEPPVLPCLHEILPDIFHYDSDLSKRQPDIELPGYSSKNTQLLSELLVGFFNYFAEFDFSTEAISVRMGCAFNKEKSSHFWTRDCSYPARPEQCKKICIEDPSSRQNTVIAGPNSESFQIILDIFESDSASLESKHDLNLIMEAQEDQSSESAPMLLPTVT